MAGVDGLVDFHRYKEGGEKQKPKFKDKGTKKQSNEKPKFKENVDYKGKVKVLDKPPNKTNLGCFICNGPNRARECPKKEKLNAFVAKENHEGAGGKTQAR